MNINDMLNGHASLVVDCVDRIYLNAYVPNLQVGGQVVQFLTGHLGNPVPSPALFNQIGNRFRRDVKAFAEAQGIPILRLKKPDRTRFDDRKVDHVRPYLERAEREGRLGVVAIVAAQDVQWVFSGQNRSRPGGGVHFEFTKSERRVGVYYVYVLDPEFGLGFLKIATYFPYPAKIWLNGHEWAKRQAARAGLNVTPLANGFASCDDPAALQGICDRLGETEIRGFFERTVALVPRPFTDTDRAAGYFWDLAIRQLEVSKTIVFDQPRRARGSFEALVENNINIGRPNKVAMVFDRRETKKTPGISATRLFDQGAQVAMDVRYQHSRVKQYPTGQRPSAYDRTCRSGLCHRLCAPHPSSSVAP